MESRANRASAGPAGMAGTIVDIGLVNGHVAESADWRPGLGVVTGTGETVVLMSGQKPAAGNDVGAAAMF